MKKIIILAAILLLLIGAVSASENVNTTNTDNILNITDQNSTDVENTQSGTLEKISDGEIEASRSATVTASDIRATAGEDITLKASVKNSSGAVSGAEVTFKLDGKTYTATSDGSGVASVVVKCPKSKAVNTQTKYNSKKLTKTTQYYKDYIATAGTGKSTCTFKVISTGKTVDTYKVSKKRSKTRSIKIKNGMKGYKKGNYGIVTRQFSKGEYKHLQVAVVGRYEDTYIPFSIKCHYKENGKWHWTSWVKIPKNKMYAGKYLKTAKVDKIKVKYSQVTYKKI